MKTQDGASPTYCLVRLLGKGGYAVDRHALQAGKFGVALLM